MNQAFDLPSAIYALSGWNRAGIMLYCNILDQPIRREFVTHHHHHVDAPHPPPTVTLSLLRLSAPRRLLVAGALIALIWAAFLWAR
jgi:hypothetical protein